MSFSELNGGMSRFWGDSRLLRTTLYNRRSKFMPCPDAASIAASNYPKNKSHVHIQLAKFTWPTGVPMHALSVRPFPRVDFWLQSHLVLSEYAKDRKSLLNKALRDIFGNRKSSQKMVIGGFGVLSKYSNDAQSLLHSAFHLQLSPNLRPGCS